MAAKFERANMKVSKTRNYFSLNLICSPLIDGLIQYRFLGNTGLRVSEISLGSW